jgi:hypothetical protein
MNQSVLECCFRGRKKGIALRTEVALAFKKGGGIGQFML